MIKIEIIVIENEMVEVEQAFHSRAWSSFNLDFPPKKQDLDEDTVISADH